MGTEVSLPSNFDSTPVYDEANDVHLARQRQFTSAASGSLGASTPAAAVVRMALDRKGGIICVNIPDAMSMQTAVRFAGLYPITHMLILFHTDMMVQRTRRYWSNCRVLHHSALDTNHRF